MTCLLLSAILDLNQEFRSVAVWYQCFGRGIVSGLLCLSASSLVMYCCSLLLPPLHLRVHSCVHGLIAIETVFEPLVTTSGLAIDTTVLCCLSAAEPHLLFSLNTMFCCRCPKLPHNSLRSAASVFEHTPICNSPGDKIMPLFGPNYNPSDLPPPLTTTHRQLHSQQTPLDTQRNELIHALDPQHQSLSAQRRLHADNPDILDGATMFEGENEQSSGVINSSVATGESSDSSIERSLSAIPEFGPERDRSHWDKAQALRNSMRSNLKESGWLGGFEPMQMHCPLLGRRVEWQAISEFAALAWRCDGLGFSWDCLHAA